MPLAGVVAQEVIADAFLPIQACRCGRWVGPDQLHLEHARRLLVACETEAALVCPGCKLSAAPLAFTKSV